MAKRQAKRFDVSSFAPETLQRTPSGGLLIPAALTRVGIFTYKTESGETIREYRPALEVFAKESLDSLQGACVTEDHPPGMVTAETWDALACGHVAEGSVKPEDTGHVAALLAVNSGPTLAKIDAGDLREVSCGYVCDLDETPGTDENGNQYDRVQRTIRYNHVALGPVGWGRAGATVCLRLDGSDDMIWCVGVTEPPGKAARSSMPRKGIHPMKFRTSKIELEGRVVRIDGARFDLRKRADRENAKATLAAVWERASEDLGALRAVERKDGTVDASVFDAALNALNEFVAQFNAALKAATESAPAEGEKTADADGEAQGEQKKSDEACAPGDKKADEGDEKKGETMDAAVQRRVELIDRARRFKPGLDPKGKSNEAIMREALAEAHPNLRADSMTGARLEGAFDAAAVPTSHPSFVELASASGPHARGDAASDGPSPQEQHHAGWANAWKKKPASR